MLFRLRPANTLTLSPELQRKNKTTGMIVCGFMLLIIGIGLFCSLMAPPAVPIDMAEVTVPELAENNVYRIEELYLGDYYAEYAETERFTGKTLNVEKQYYNAFLTDSKGDFYIISLAVEPDDDIKAAVDAYMADLDIPIGDVSVSGYFKATALDSDLLAYYEESTLWYEGTELDLPVCNLTLEYECSLDTDYAEYAEKVAWEGRIVALVFVGLGLLLGIWGIVARKNLKKRIQEKAAAVAETEN